MQTNCHMSVLVHEQAKKYGDREMLIYQDFGREMLPTSNCCFPSLRLKSKDGMPVAGSVIMRPHTSRQTSSRWKCLIRWNWSPALLRHS